MNYTIELTYTEASAAATASQPTTGSPSYGGKVVITGGGKVDSTGGFKLPTLKVGDKLKFKSSQNYTVNIELLPKSMFWPTNLFSTDEGFCKTRRIYPNSEVTVVDVGPYRCCCGYVENDKTYGYPDNSKLGIGPDPDDSDS